MLKVFISHATEDGEIADALAKSLRASFRYERPAPTALHL
jgi:hypothetical protein